ncbi:MAG: IS1634 family transposase [Planctomycetaceae bacterium]|nr:MAG: IS1634 family transposase [Planctomycetaceae bacterium]
MFFRQKRSGGRVYLQIVENRWEDGRARQTVIATLGRVDHLRASGQLDALLQSGAKFAEQVLVVSAHKNGQAPSVQSRSVGPALVFGRLWEELGIPQVIERLLRGRRFELPLERILFLTVLHRLMESGSDRSCMLDWKRDFEIPGVEGVALHQAYRAMAWLGEPLPDADQADATPFAPRCIKDTIEEALFARRRDLFTELELVFFDTTSIYFEGQGGQTLGQYGYSKDHRPDCKQMLVGVILDHEGQPVCCELWPGNVADVKTLVPIVDRLRKRFHIGSICIVADRGMISRQTIKELQSADRRTHFILGARMRSVKEVDRDVLSRAGRYHAVRGPRQKSDDPSPLQVKEVWVEDRRYIVCVNSEQAKKDKADREETVAALREQLKKEAKTLVGNTGYRRYLRSQGASFEIDEEKIQREERYDGKWVIQTDRADLCSTDVALKYKQLWMVEDMHRTGKSLLETRPIFHKRDETIRGHVFCSFLALLLRTELLQRVESRGDEVEWVRMLSDLQALRLTDVVHHDQRFQLRTDVRGDCAAAFRAAGVAIPPTVQKLEN